MNSEQRRRTLKAMSVLYPGRRLIFQPEHHLKLLGFAEEVERPSRLADGSRVEIATARKKAVSEIRARARREDQARRSLLRRVVSFLSAVVRGLRTSKRKHSRAIEREQRALVAIGDMRREALNRGSH